VARDVNNARAEQEDSMRTALSTVVHGIVRGGILLIAISRFSTAHAQPLYDPPGSSEVQDDAQAATVEPAQPIDPYTPDVPYPAKPGPTLAEPGCPNAPMPTEPYWAPPCCCNACTPCGAPLALKPVIVSPRPPVWDGVRRFSIGVHGTTLWLNQDVGGEQMVLGGAGLQLRLRSRGRFGLEFSQSFLHATYLNGNFDRSSFPFTFSLMYYVFPNQDWRHFNIYGVAGVGAMFDAITLLDEHRLRVEQDFVEWIGHVGVGAELRFQWFAIEADARLIGTLRDDTSTPASYYQGVQGGPIPDSSWGVSGNVYLSLWF
jgi:hypothetical protein